MGGDHFMLKLITLTSMTNTDTIILIVVVLLLLSIIFFRYLFPLIRGKKTSHCSSCPIAKDKKIKRSLNAYKKTRDKEKNK